MIDIKFLFFGFIIMACIGVDDNVYSQNLKVADSLSSLLNEDTLDNQNRINILLDICKSSSSPIDISNFGQQALTLAKDLNDRDLQAKALYQLGRSEILKGELIKGNNFLFQALSLFEEMDNVNGYASTCDLISGAYLSMKDFQNSREYQLKSLDLTQIDSIRKAGFINNLGEIYRQWEKFDSANLYFHQAKMIYEMQNYKLGIAYTYGNIGLVHAELDQYDSAEFYLYQATNILEQLGDRYPIAVYQTYMADIYRDKQDWERALAYANNSYQISIEEGLKEQIRDASLMLSELYHDKGDFQKAYDYQSQYIAYRDSINNDDVIRAIADLRTEYEVSKKQAEVDLLEQKRENEKWIMFSLLSVLGFISVVAFFTFKNNLARKRTNMLLGAQKTKIENQNDKLEGLIKMKDKFFGIISHDLRSPVNSLNGITQLLKHFVKTKNTEELEQLTILMDKSVESLSTLLDNLLNWALSQQGALPYEPKPIHAEPLVNNVLEIFKNAARAKSIELQVEIDEHLVLLVDEDSVHALLRNVLNNAIKFTHEKGEVVISARVGEDNALITIRDNGQGMNDYQLRNLFKVNKKKVSKGTMGEKGSGLGMLLCKEIVKLNNGKIEAESEMGKGTKITIELPIYP